MIINATLLMQAVNFLIAYGMLHFFFFKPVFAVIEREDAVEKSYHTTVADHKKAIAHAEQRMHEEWQSCRHYFEHNKPTLLSMTELRQPRMPLRVTMPSDKQLLTLKNEVEQLIISKVTHVS